MNALRVAGVGFLILGAHFLTGCGGVPAALAVSGASLNGNWNIVGNGAPASFPSLSFALIVEGNQLYAQGNMDVGCDGPPGGQSGGGGGLYLTGQLAADGTFTLTEPAGTGLTLDGNPIQVVVTGTAAGSTAASWTGTYAMTTAADATGCIVNETGSFTATAFAPVTGTYSGALTEDNSGTVGVNATVDVTQGTAASEKSIEQTTTYYLPLTATIAVTGIPCFTHGTSSVSQLDGLNTVEGSIVSMGFLMDDGSQLLMLGQMTGTDAASINFQLIAINGGQCANSYNGTLSQP